MDGSVEMCFPLSCFIFQWGKKKEKRKKACAVCITEMTGMEWNCVSNYDSVLFFCLLELKYICLSLYTHTYYMLRRVRKDLEKGQYNSIPVG